MAEQLGKVKTDRAIKLPINNILCLQRFKGGLIFLVVFVHVSDCSSSEAVTSVESQYLSVAVCIGEQK